MRNIDFLRVLGAVVALGLATACGGDDTKAAPTDDDDSTDQTDDGTDDEKNDDASGSKIDGGSKMDGGNKGNASGDAGVKVDAGKGGGTGLDSGTDVPKVDAGGPPASALKPKCVKKDSQVMIIGDSYINWISHTFPQDIVNVSKQNWRMLAVGGFSMGSGGIGSIPKEYDDSIAMDPDAHTILMDGGGNDLLVADASLGNVGDCKTDKAPTLPVCKTIIDKAITAADELLQRASKAGIRDVIYFFYPHVPNGTALGGPNPNAMLDYALPMVKSFCDGVEGKTNGKTRCTFVDMVPVFQGHDDWFFPGDIHPVSMGSQAMAKKIWEVMSDKCIGQKEKDCCEP